MLSSRKEFRIDNNIKEYPNFATVLPRSNDNLFGVRRITSFQTQESNSLCPDIKDVNNNSKSPNLNEAFITRSGENEDDVTDDCARSKIYIRTRQTNEIHLLEFKATEVKVIPLYLKDRIIEGMGNHKCIQANTTTIYRNVSNKNANGFNQIIKTFKIDHSKSIDNISVMSIKKSLYPKWSKYPLEQKKKPCISDPVTNIKESIIFLAFKDVLYKVTPGLMNLRSSNYIDYEAEKKGEKLLRELRMPLPTVTKNRGQIVVKYKGDILKFLFSLSDVNCSKLKVTSSVGVMAKDDNVYIMDFNTVNKRKCYIAVPRSNYEYNDVMMKVRQKNRTMEFHKREPIWLTEQRKKRIKEYHLERKKQPYEDIMDLKLGSTISYEGFNCINKVKGGTLSCTVSDDNYEKWVRQIKKTELLNNEDNYYEKVESKCGSNVPNWDFILNMK